MFFFVSCFIAFYIFLVSHFTAVMIFLGNWANISVAIQVTNKVLLKHNTQNIGVANMQLLLVILCYHRAFTTFCFFPKVQRYY